MRTNTYLFLYILMFLQMIWFSCQVNQTPDTNSANTNLDTIQQDQSDEIEPQEAPAITANQDVWGYYQTLHKQYAPTFPIEFKNGKYQYQTGTGYWRDAIVDIPNGYIEIYDEGTGDGYYHLQFVQFKKSDGGSVIQISTKIHDGISPRATVKAIDVSSAPMDITKQVYAGLDAFAFLPADYAEEEGIVNDVLPVLIDLPRKGTQAKATVSTEKKLIFCNDSATEKQAIGCAVIGRVNRKEITLKWDRDAGVFRWK